MEQEFKWCRNSEDLKLLTYLGPPYSKKCFQMSATYYDTKDGMLSSHKGGLRIRQENEQSICCLKLSMPCQNGLFQRQEFEVPAKDIQTGLTKLMQTDAPDDFCRTLLHKGVEPICQIDFTRLAFTYHFPSFSMEVALDDGFFNKKTPFSELEAELKSGDFFDFYNFCINWQEKHHLQPQPFSKLARAMHSY